MPLTCAYCPVRVLEKRLFAKRLRCSVSGRYVALGMACGAETEQLREAVAAGGIFTQGWLERAKEACNGL